MSLSAGRCQVSRTRRPGGPRQEQVGIFPSGQAPLSDAQACFYPNGALKPPAYVCKEAIDRLRGF